METIRSRVCRSDQTVPKYKTSRSFEVLSFGSHDSTWPLYRRLLWIPEIPSAAPQPRVRQPSEFQDGRNRLSHRPLRCCFAIVGRVCCQKQKTRTQRICFAVPRRDAVQTRRATARSASLRDRASGLPSQSNVKQLPAWVGQVTPDAGTQRRSDQILRVPDHSSRSGYRWAV